MSSPTCRSANVGVTTSPDIWLNEAYPHGPIAYARTVGDASPAKRLRRLKREPASKVNLWNPPPAALRDPSQLFAASVYVRGGMALEALRDGSRRGVLLHAAHLAATHRDGDPTLQDFTALAGQHSNEPRRPLGRYLYSAAAVATTRPAWRRRRRKRGRRNSS